MLGHFLQQYLAVEGRMQVEDAKRSRRRVVLRAGCRVARSLHATYEGVTRAAPIVGMLRALRCRVFGVIPIKSAS
jgi:hypothetical protein